MHAPDVIARPAPTARRWWLHGPLQDTLLGWCFLPVAIVVHFAEPHLTLVQTMVGVIFLVSFAHQPLTLGLVYGDPAQRAAHRRLCLWAPLVAVVLIALGLSISLTLVGVTAGLWNARELLGILRGLADLRIVGGDVVEVAPAYDHAEITSVAASAIAYEMITMMAARLRA